MAASIRYNPSLQQILRQLEIIHYYARNPGDLIDGSIVIAVQKYSIANITKDPGPVVLPIEWASEKQRRAFFATNGFGAGIPYSRSGDIHGISFGVAGNEIRIAYEQRGSNYVIGLKQQPFHKNTGWQYAPNHKKPMGRMMMSKITQNYFARVGAPMGPANAAIPSGIR